MQKPCIICNIIKGIEFSCIVYENDDCIAFLDKRPLFPGHTLLAPKVHIETMADLSAELNCKLFSITQKLGIAVQNGTGSQGTFIAINNRVSQSIPHLHIHIVPRTKGDGLRGFFWPRKKYPGESEMDEIKEKIRQAL